MGRLGEETHRLLTPSRAVEYYLDVGTLGTDKPFEIAAMHRLCNEISPEFILNVPQPCFYGDALQLGTFLKPKLFDLVTCLDMIEHLTKDDGWKLIETLEGLCKGRLIFFTPLGEIWINQDKKPFHTHLSGWLPEEFTKLGYSCWVFPDCHKYFGAFYAVKDFEGEVNKPVLDWVANLWVEG